MNKTKYTIYALGVEKDNKSQWMAQYEKREAISGGSFDITTESLNKIFENKEDAMEYTYSYLIKNGIDKGDIYKEDKSEE